MNYREYKLKMTLMKEFHQNICSLLSISTYILSLIWKEKKIMVVNQFKKEIKILVDFNSH